MNIRRKILGSMGLFEEEEDYERETSVVSSEKGKFSSGSIEFKKKEVETKRKVIFFQNLKEDAKAAQEAKEKLLFEEEMDDIVTNLPTEQKNRLLHYQASYKDRSIYQRAALRRKLIEDKKKTEDKEKAASIPSPAKKPSALEGAFEGGSGTQGSGQANLSAQAVG
ncbi:MAG: hypothetical protein Q7R77_00035 [Candidatus Daviesbacteria bacterium]|nr:hypothetical protein [Candidatus Daviesbacteria bacterium]